MYIQVANRRLVRCPIFKTLSPPIPLKISPTGVEYVGYNEEQRKQVSSLIFRQEGGGNVVYEMLLERLLYLPSVAQVELVPATSYRRLHRLQYRSPISETLLELSLADLNMGREVLLLARAVGVNSVIEILDVSHYTAYDQDTQILRSFFFKIWCETELVTSFQTFDLTEVRFQVGWLSSSVDGSTQTKI